MNARDEILSSIRARRTTAAPAPEVYSAPAIDGDLADAFAKRAGYAHTEVRTVDSLADVPAAIADILRAKNMEARVHLPPDAALNALPWTGALAIERTPPGPDDAAVAIAPLGIAETGTLAYPAREASPASWHFRAGLEIAILRAGSIKPRMEDVVAAVKKAGTFPHTINFVTGPSRTGDIEQTLELGAHGPKALAVVIVRA
jgi:L-lactate dehydrogenase complex protein LldG